MNEIKVIAKQMGYYGNQLRPEGAVFEVDPKDLKKDKDGKVVLALWMDAAEEVVETKVVAKESVSKKSKDVAI